MSGDTLDPHHKEMDPALFCYKELEPLLREIARLVKSAPLSEKERSGLAMMILADVAGTTLSVIGLEATPANVGQLGEFMQAAFTVKAIN